MALTETVKAKVEPSMKLDLERMAREEGPGVTISDLVRRAIHHVYFKENTTLYPLEEITALRAAEMPKKSITR
jgi:hypothetical protein